MTIPSLLFSQYTPTEVEVDSLGIGISQESLKNLDLGDTHLVVGETINTHGNKSYGIVVDKQGVGVNTSIQSRFDNIGYNLFVDGDVNITGKIIANGIYSSLCNVSTNCNYWLMSDDDLYQNIYYTDTVSIVDTSTFAYSNTYGLNIVKTANKKVEKLQLSIENTEAAQIRFGFFGSSNLTPSIINTPPGTPIEFHSGRDESYFNRVYTSSNYLTTVLNNVTGLNETKIVSVIDEVPHYELASSNDAPHLIIDTVGNVGIHTSSNLPLSYSVRSFGIDNGIYYSNVVNPMTLHVTGSIYGDDIIMKDRDTGLTKHIDDLYARRLGPTFSPCQILPGEFSEGDYLFKNKLYVNDELITSNLKVFNNADTNNFVGSNCVINHSMFLDDIKGNNDLYLDGSVRFAGQLFHKEYVLDENTGSNVESWVSINFNSSDTSLSNINYIGSGITTPGRLGTGINPRNPLSAFPYDNTVDTQFSINKSDSNIWELKILDKSQTGSTSYRKVAYIGHPPSENQEKFIINTSQYEDASLVFATPMQNDPQFTGSLNNINQNFYFFPGADFKSEAGPILDRTRPPTLGIFADPSNPYDKVSYSPGRVGINTYNPFGTKHTKGLDVNGSIQFSDIVYNNNVELGINNWLVYRDVNPNSNILGVYYYNEKAPYLGVNGLPDNRYSLVNYGKFKTTQGIFNQNDCKLGYWYDNTDRYTVNNNIAPTNKNSRQGIYTFSKIGINSIYPTADLDIYNNYDKDTSIKLHASLTSNISSLIFSGSRNNDWSIRVNDNTPSTFQVGYGSNINNNNSNERAIWSKFNNVINRHQVFIGCNLLCPDYITYGTNNTGGRDLTPKYPILTVGGDLSVNGNVGITGQYYMQGKLQINSNINGWESLCNVVPTDNDVYIGGNTITLTPNVNLSNKVTISDGVLYDASSLNPIANKSIFEVQQSKTTGTDNTRNIIASFITPNPSGLLLLTAKSKNILFGILNDQITQQSSFGIFDGNTNPYLYFKDTANTNEKLIGINTKNPSSIIHINTSSSSQKCIKITQNLSGYDIANYSPDITFEKVISTPEALTITKDWSICAPLPNNSTISDKLSVNYSINNPLSNIYNSAEIFTITDQGCIGINNEYPTYALDVISNGKNTALRLLNYDNNSNVQILLQSREHSNITNDPSYYYYGNTNNTDYEISVVNDEFNILSKSLISYNKLISCSNGSIGLGSNADLNYKVNVSGDINVIGGIFVDGYPLVKSGHLIDGYHLAATNIFLDPDIGKNGGVIVNGVSATNNLFHIFSGSNANLLVLDSHYEECQINLKALTSNNPNYQNSYRVGISNETFYWEYRSNISIIDYTDTGLHTNYSPVANITKSSNDFNLTLNGSIILNSYNPSIYYNNGSKIGSNDSNLYILPSLTGNIGIGTIIPKYNTHVYGNNKVSMVVETIGNKDPLRIISNDNQYITINSNGNLGIGSTNPKSSLDIVGNINITNGSSNNPSYTFSSSSNTGIYLTNDNDIAITTSGKERFIIDPVGNLGIGTNDTSLNFVSISSNINYTLLNLHQSGTGNILEVENNTKKALLIDNKGNVGIGIENPLYILDINGDIGITGNIIPKTNNSYDIGNLSKGWNNLFISGNRSQYNVTKVTKITDDYIVFGDKNTDLSIPSNNLLHSIKVDSVRFANNDSLFYGTISNSTNDNTIFNFQMKNYISGTVVNYNPVLIKQATQTVAIGDNNNEDATLHITTTKQIPSVILTQRTTEDIILLNNNTKNVAKITSSGYVGIGTEIPDAIVDIYGNNSTEILNVMQSSIGNIAKFSNSTNNSNIVFDYRGNVGIGTNTPISSLHVEGDTYINGHIRASSNVYFGSNLTVFGNTHTLGNTITDSDRNIKTNIKKIENALDKICNISGYTFDLIKNNNKSTGLIAQEVLSILPEAVTKSDTGVYGIAYGNMMGLIIEGIKELKMEIENIKNIK